MSSFDINPLKKRDSGSDLSQDQREQREPRKQPSQGSEGQSRRSGPKNRKNTQEHRQSDNSGPINLSNLTNDQGSSQPTRRVLQTSQEASEERASPNYTNNHHNRSEELLEGFEPTQRSDRPQPPKNGQFNQQNKQKGFAIPPSGEIYHGRNNPIHERCQHQRQLEAACRGHSNITNHYNWRNGQLDQFQGALPPLAQFNQNWVDHRPIPSQPQNRRPLHYNNNNSTSGSINYHPAPLRRSRRAQEPLNHGPNQQQQEGVFAHQSNIFGSNQAFPTKRDGGYQYEGTTITKRIHNHSQKHNINKNCYKLTGSSNQRGGRRESVWRPASQRVKSGAGSFRHDYNATLNHQAHNLRLRV